MIKKSQEDYLRAMYELRERQLDKIIGIKKTEIATVLNISKSGVTQMMNKLLDSGMINMDLYSRIFFTKKGLVSAEKITRKHRIVEVFLRNVLHYKSLKKICEEAHKLEHSFSDDSIKRLDDFLGNPKKCPHGEIISD
jgi:DtxR family Mn-dependent transcriptional regulator